MFSRSNRPINCRSINRRPINYRSTNYRSINHRLIARMFVSFGLSLVLIYGPVLPVASVRAELPATANTEPGSQPITRQHRRGELIVGFKDGLPQWEHDLIVRTFGKGEKVLRGRGRVSRLTVRDGSDLSRTIADLRQLKSLIEYVEPNYIVTRTGDFSRSPAVPNDPKFAEQWALANIGQHDGVIGADIGAVAGWRQTIGSRETIMAVIDTGVDTNHPDLIRNLWINRREAEGDRNFDDDRNGYIDDVAGWNFVDDSPDVDDDQGHGTAMAGIIAAEADNGRGISGVMWQASIMPLKALDGTGTGAVSDVVEAIDYAAAHGASVINCSFGTEGYSQALLDAINRAAASGVLVVASAGNNGWDLSQTPFYPASYQAGNLITVAASTNSDQLASVSNWGAGSVQVAAPGVEILTTSRDGSYLSVTGTSAAAALVTGVAGLLKTMRDWVSAQTIRQSLIDGARRANSLQGKVSSSGVVSAGRSIIALMKDEETEREEIANEGKENQEKENQEKEGGNSGSTGSGGSGGGSNGDGSGEGGGSGVNNGQAGPLNLDYMRDHRPTRAEPRVSINLPPEGWEPPEATGSDENYSAMATRPENRVGIVSRVPAQMRDRTIHNSSSVNQSINLGSRNINFNLPVLRLGGRGMGIDLTLSYNSNSIWLKDQWTGRLGFNLDNGFPGPGWSFGFGKLLGGVPSFGSTSIPPVWNRDLGRYVYIWVEPDGTRRTLVGGTSATGTIYKSVDSSHIEYSRGDDVMYLSNGTYIWFKAPTNAQGRAIGKELLPREIKDRNGNQIIIFNAALSNGRWVIDYVTDTMGRTIDFYYENNLLTQVRQNRGGTWHVFVKFIYEPVVIRTNFSGVNVDPANIGGQTVWEPWFIEFPNRMSYRLFHTTYCQVYQIEKWTPEIAGQGGARPVAFTHYDLPSVGLASLAGMLPPGGNTPQSDCPKFSTRDEWAENWSRGESGWVTSGNYRVARYSYYFFTDGNGTHAKITDPIGRIYRSDVSTDQLNHLDRVWPNSAAYGSDGSPGTPLKTTTTRYDSAYDGLRVKEVTVADGVSTKRTAIHYTILNGISLPQDVIEYENGGSSEYRRTTTHYKTDSAYHELHLLALPTEVIVSQPSAAGSNRVKWQVFNYDEPAYFDASDFSVVGHDGLYHGPGFLTRGNVTTVNEYDSQTGGWRTPTRTTYNKTGMVTAVADAAGNTTRFFYDDHFLIPISPPASRGLVTRIKDPDGYWSGAEYNWYTGQPASTYHIAGTSGTGPFENTVTYTYDDLDRLTSVNRPPGHGGQISYAYWDNWLATAVYTKIDATRTSYSFTAYDGAGRGRWQGATHPDGVNGQFTMARSTYDAVGRTIAESSPTAVNGNGDPIGDDAAGGWLYTTTVYDGLDRQLTVARPDGNTIQYLYNGCGCAGNASVVVTDERGRKRKTIYDFLGRVKEAHNLASSGSTYSKAVYTYDASDQLARIEHYNGGGAHQDRIFSYDGYGRLASQTTPEAGAISYGYHPNDRIAYVENSRIVSGSVKYRATFGYNGRGQLTEVKYHDNGATPDVYYEYGEYGELTWMREKNDAGTILGSTQYVYDPYQRLQSETRVFNGMSGIFRVSYGYNLADALNQVRSTINDWERSVYYDYSDGGALAKVGSDLASGAVAENIARDFSYQAFFKLKNVTYGNGRKLAIGYDRKRSQMTSLQVRKTDWTDPIMNLSYDYSNGGGGSPGNNGRIRQIRDNLDGVFTAEFGYDDHNRLTSYGSTYNRSYSYDAWGNLTGVSSTREGGDAPNYVPVYAANSSGAPLNNRIGNIDYLYDAAGNMLSDGGQNYTYDAASRLKTASGGGSSYDYDGNGNRVRQTNSGGTLYYLWSSVLGQPVVEIAPQGQPSVYRAYVYSPRGQMIALQSNQGGLYWLHRDHLGSGRKLTDVNGTVVYRGEFDPHGQTLYEWTGPGAGYLNSHKFTGYERDGATGLDNAKARTYHYRRGRFMQPDPLGLGSSDLADPQSLNLYSYVRNDPANATDPSGLMCSAEFGFSACYGNGGFWGWGDIVNYRGADGISDIIESEYAQHQEFAEGRAFHSIFEDYEPWDGWEYSSKGGGGGDEKKDFEDCVKDAYQDYDIGTRQAHSARHYFFNGFKGAAAGATGSAVASLFGPIGWLEMVGATLVGAGIGVLDTFTNDTVAVLDEADKFRDKVLEKCAKASPNAYANYKSQFNHQSRQINNGGRGHVPTQVLFYDQRQAVVRQLGIPMGLAESIFR